MFLTIEDPANVAVSAVRHALQDAGIVVRGGSRVGASPASAVPIFTLASKPLAEIVRDMNKNSNNFIAEMLQRALGAETYGPPASREKGAQAVASFLRTCGIDPEPFTLTDGSGLSRSNRVSVSGLARILVRMWGDPRIGSPFLDSLPIGGIDGTLKGRMFGPARGRVRAKTGYIDGVTALAGYVPDTREGPVAFAFVVNGTSHPRTVRALDDLCGPPGQGVKWERGPRDERHVRGLARRVRDLVPQPVRSRSSSSHRRARASLPISVKIRFASVRRRLASSRRSRRFAI